jgi:hypothetical protein
LYQNQLSYEIFLRWHLIKHMEDYHGKVAQVVDILNSQSESPTDQMKAFRNKGCCRAVMVEIFKPTDLALPAKKRKAMDSIEIVANDTENRNKE